MLQLGAKVCICAVVRGVLLAKKSNHGEKSARCALLFPYQILPLTKNRIL